MSSRSEAGYTLIEIMITLMVFAILAGAAIPQFTDLTGNMRLRQGLREVERELQTARLKAVTSNRAIRVRFNCPVVGEYRMVEVIGTPSDPDTDDDPDNLGRCSLSDYPYPAADVNRLTLPNHDGPLRTLHSTLSFGAADDLEFWPDGSAHQLDADETIPWPVIPATGTAITITKGTSVGVVEVNGLGKIQIQ